MRYRHRTLMIVLALGPPLIAAVWLDVMSVVIWTLTALAVVEVVEFVRVNLPRCREDK